jgi:hypothetical protein
MRFTRRRRRVGKSTLSVHQRPFTPGDRSQSGHWVDQALETRIELANANFGYLAILHNGGTAPLRPACAHRYSSNCYTKSLNTWPETNYGDTAKPGLDHSMQHFLGDSHHR